jgi:glycosyltransferase involved in cell wall biosynthesis
MVSRDDARGMADAALRLLRDDALALRIGDEARAECQRRYVWPAVQREWEQLYAGLHGARSEAAIGAVARA